jgi:hypothetical protein
MTTFTSDDREEAYKKMLEEAPAHIGYEDAVEPIPFAGLVRLQDKKDTEQMLRDQLHVLQAECQRLRRLLREAGINE